MRNQLFLTFYGLLDVAAQIYMTVSAKYIVQDQPFSINCSSAVPPLGDAVSFGKESRDIINIRYLNSIPACYGTLSSGLQPPYKCKQQCGCSMDRRSYQWTFNGKDVDDINTFHCTMLFPLSGESTQSRLILKAVAPELVNDTSSSSGEDIRIADGENLNITVVVIAHPGPTSVFWLFRHDDNADPVKIPKKCTTYSLARYTCTLWVKETNQSNFGRYALHFQNEIGSPLRVDFVVKGKKMPSPPDINATCAENKVNFNWISGFDGGEKQIFYVIALSVLQNKENILAIFTDEGFGTHNTFSVDLQTGKYIFYIFTNNSYGGVNSSKKACEVFGICYSAVAVYLPTTMLTVMVIITTAFFVYRNHRYIQMEADIRECNNRKIQALKHMIEPFNAYCLQRNHFGVSSFTLDFDDQ